MRIHNIQNFKDFHRLENIWNPVVSASSFNSIFLSYEWFLSWWQSLSGKNTLEILIITEGDETVGIAPLMRNDDSLYFIASREVTDYCDFIFPQDKYQFYLNESIKFVHRNLPGITRLELINIPSDSTTLALLPKFAAEYGYSGSSFECETTSTLSLPTTYTEYLAGLGRKCRHELRRKMKHMDSLPGIRIAKITQDKDLRFALDDFIGLHKASHPDKAEFWGNPGMVDFFKCLTHLFSQNSWIELNLLYKANSLMAGLLNFRYKDRIYFYNTAYDPEYASYSPGIYLFINSIKQAIEEKKKIADFLRGQEKYKFDFGAKKNTIHDLELFCGETGI